MADWNSVFQGKKITVMGLGLLGRGVGDAKFLAEQGAELMVTDLKSEAELAESLEKLQGFSNITYRLGGHDLADFKDRDFILKAAGVPLESPYIAEAQKNSIPIKMSASWFAELAGIPIVGVTGTRGKSTTTHMLYAILQEAGKHVLLGGNVRGVSTLALLSEVTPESIALFELDSWQCQGFGDALISPNVAVFTTFFDDHLNYYKNDRAQYLEDKAQISLYQHTGDMFVLGAQARDAVLGAHTPPATSRVVDSSLVEGWELQVLGEHNRYNAACAVAAAFALGVDEEICKKALAKFKGVPGRLELVREVNGVEFYNDTTATTPEATLAALRALGGTRNVVLIMGGADKGLDMSSLIALLLESTKYVTLLDGTGTRRILPELPTTMINHSSLKEALRDALTHAEPGDSVVLSPAFASFGMFKNEYDRGDQFNELVRAL